VGCRQGVIFPAQSLSEQAQAAGASAAYATGKAGGADFFFFADSAGRVVRIGYDVGGDGKPDQVINLDRISFQQCRHLVIILDGFGYEVVKKFYDEGHLRLFHAPSKVVSPYPTLTDLAIEDALAYSPCRGMEALYYDRRKGAVVGGSMAYLGGENQPYDRLLQYRAAMLWDAIGYLYPWAVFGKEVNDAKALFDKAATQEMLAYFVSSAGVGTAQGADGQRRCLELVERLVNQITWETRGLTKITMLADHGHSYTPSTRIALEDYLTAKGWRLTDSPTGARDVAYVRFGLETYASFATNSAADLAADLAAAEGVELASFAQGPDVVVLGRDGGKAVISRHGQDRYGYRCVQGDPLKLNSILSNLNADADGSYDGRELLAATIDHVYPDAPARLWRAHFAMVENPPDVIVSLEDKYYSGSRSFGGSVKVASTHGSLNSRNSLTFIMSTAGPLPAFLRSADIPAEMRKMTGAKFPMRK